MAEVKVGSPDEMRALDDTELQQVVGGSAVALPTLIGQANTWRKPKRNDDEPGLPGVVIYSDLNRNG